MKNTSTYTYKGHTATITREILWMSCFGPDTGQVTFESDVLRCKSPEIPWDSTIPVLINIYKKYFERNVDKALSVGMSIA
jgi:hypothetical protein